MSAAAATAAPSPARLVLVPTDRRRVDLPPEAPRRYRLVRLHHAEVDRSERFAHLKRSHD